MMKAIAGVPGQPTQYVPMSDAEIAQATADAAAFAALQPKLAIQAQITALEATQTPRRIRQAMAGTDGGWLAALETQIAALRAQL